jgi:NAD(P)-dependent dehydrogenase (short-subunit alcohol dehydrogenase family)
VQLDGKVAIVTGGNAGIGLATARLLASEGAAVVVAARHAGRGKAAVGGIVEAGGEAVFVRADVGVRRHVERIIDAAVSAFGGIDLLVNNAGIEAARRLLETDEAHWDRVVDTNLKGTFLCAVSSVPHMVRRGGGAIVNTSSVLALGSIPGSGAYSAAKAGVLGLTRSMALEWGPLGIRVNCVLPGSTDTSMMWRGLREEEIPTDRKRVEETIPLGRVADPDEIARATLWLCTPAASFANGSFLVLDGGQGARFPALR